MTPTETCSVCYHLQDPVFINLEQFTSRETSEILPVETVRSRFGSDLLFNIPQIFMFDRSNQRMSGKTCMLRRQFPLSPCGMRWLATPLGSTSAASLLLPSAWRFRRRRFSPARFTPRCSLSNMNELPLAGQQAHERPIKNSTRLPAGGYPKRMLSVTLVRARVSSPSVKSNF